MLTITFWKDALGRALRTAAQTAAGCWTTDVLIMDLPWKVMLGLAGTAALYSILTSISTEPIGPRGVVSTTDLTPTPAGETVPGGATHSAAEKPPSSPVEASETTTGGSDTTGGETLL
jgi:hypothetical protein